MEENNTSQEMSKKERRELRREERRLQEAQQRAKQKKSRFLKWLGVVVILSGVVALLIYSAESEKRTGGEIMGELTLYDDEWEKGNSDSPLVIVEYSDFECPACRHYYPMFSRLMDEMGDDVRFVYRHFPLRSIHRVAQTASQASEAAGAQGKFWEMHDLLFENQNAWAGLSVSSAEDIFIALADELDLDVEEFMDYMKSGDAKDAVNDDFVSGVSVGINSTPTFFINGTRIDNPRDYDSLSAEIRFRLKGLDIPKTATSTPENIE